MIFDRYPEKCDKCGKNGNTWSFLSIKGKPKICENCIARILFEKELYNDPEYEEKYYKNYNGNLSEYEISMWRRFLKFIMYDPS